MITIDFAKYKFNKIHATMQMLGNSVFFQTLAFRARWTVWVGSCCHEACGKAVSDQRVRLMFLISHKKRDLGGVVIRIPREHV